MIKSGLVLTIVSFLACYQLYSQKIEAPAILNTPCDEQNPIIDETNGVIYFTRSRHPENVGGERDRGDIWYSQLQGGKSWSEPKNARILNNSGWNGIIGLSENGDILLHGHYENDNQPVRSQGIALARKQDTGWSRPVNITIPYYKNLSMYFGGSLSADGNTLLLALEGYGTRGTEDIYVCFKKGDGWTEPKNLGSDINTKYQEFTPVMNGSMDTLYFSSNGHQGSSSSDVFMSVRLDSSWSKWSKPQLLDHINTTGKEMGYRRYKGFAVYTSTQNSDGYGDVKFYFDRDDDILQQPSEVDTTQLVNLTEAMPLEMPKTHGDFTLTGKVTDASTGSTLPANLSIQNKDNSFAKQAKINQTGQKYALALPSSGSYVIRADAPGYISHQEKFEVVSTEPRVLEMNFSLQKIEIGTRVNLENVLFKQSKAEILPSSYEELNLVVELMLDNPTMKIKLEGHTDNRGDAKQNLMLSKERIKAVQKYLVKRGISKKRVTGKGYGGTRPIANNDDPETRKLNRRVEFTIVQN